MIDIILKLFFKKADCSEQSIAEIERQLNAEINFKYDRHC